MIPQAFQVDRVEKRNGQWTEEASLQLTNITQWGVTELLIDFNHRATLVNEIAHISFNALVQLSLGGNNIDSIEGLPRVQMTHIKFMFLHENNITSVRMVRKAEWPALRILNIDRNFFGDAKSLAHGCFPQIYTLFVNVVWGEDKNKMADKCFPAKMQAASLNRLSIRANKLCFDRSIKRVLKQRWLHVFIQ